MLSLALVLQSSTGLVLPSAAPTMRAAVAPARTDAIDMKAVSTLLAIRQNALRGCFLAFS